MSEAKEQSVTHRSPLHATHVRLGAMMKECDGWSVPASYGDDLLEYAAVRERGAGLIDFSSRGRFHVTGSEAVPFLNGLITNDMKTLAEKTWMPAAFPSVQGRLIASVRIVRFADDTTHKNSVPVFLIDTEAASRERVLSILQRFTLAGDFHATDVTSRHALLSVQGKRAQEVVQCLLGDAVVGIPPKGVAKLTWQQKEVTVLYATHAAEHGFDLIVDADTAVALWDALVNTGARPVGDDALEMLRIEAGVPHYGLDMDEGTVVTEVLDEAVSYTKGCYVGQEIIARIKYRGHVAKKLVGIAFDRIMKLDDEKPVVRSDGKDIGRITSIALSPHLGRMIALGYIKYDYIAPGTDVRVSNAAGEIAAKVTELPFVRGSSPESNVE